MITRDTALINNQILLVVQFFSEDALIDVHSVDAVELHNADPDDSLPIQTIESTDITHTSTGTYSYVVGPYENTGVYYDRVFFTPLEGAHQEYVTNSFTVRELTTVSSLGLETCALRGTLVKPDGEPISDALIAINKVDFQSQKDHKIVGFYPREKYTDQNGTFLINVLTETKFAISIPVIGYRRIFVIPSGTTEKNIGELDSWLYSPVDNPGESNDYLGSSSGIVRPSSTGYASNFQKEQNFPVFQWDA